MMPQIIYIFCNWSSKFTFFSVMKTISWVFFKEENKSICGIVMSGQLEGKENGPKGIFEH